MPGKTFISYRRDDDPAFAARVRDGLAARFGKTALFMDVDNLLAGQRFDDELAKALADCDVLVAIIGARWMDVLAAKTAGSERDYVREEIGAALQRRIVVIPVRVGRDGSLAPLPRPTDLPDDIRELVQHQKHDVTHERFGRDVGDLAQAIATMRRGNGKALPLGKIAATALVALLLGGGVVANQAGLLRWPGEQAASQRSAEAAASAAAETKRLADLDNRLKQEAEARTIAEAESRRQEEAGALARREQDIRQKAAAEAAAKLKREADERAAEKEKADTTERQRLAAETKLHVEAERAWAAAKNSSRPADLKTFLERHGTSAFAEVARTLLDEIERVEAGKQPAKPARRITFGPISELVLLANGTWIEFQAGAPVWTFRTVSDQSSELVVFDATRDSYLSLKLAEKQTYFRNGPLGTWVRFVPIKEIVDERPRDRGGVRGSDDAKAKFDPALAVAPGSGRSFHEAEADGKPCPMCPEMVVVPAGDGVTGEGRSQKKITIVKAFAVGKFTVTFDEWDACVADSGCASSKNPSDEGWGKGRRPVINVSWNDANEYSAWLTKKTGRVYRLLTEAEWEYAARAGSRTIYPWGDAVGKGNANCFGCDSQWEGSQTAPVGQFKPNAFGLHDMNGNVNQMCQDNWHENYSGAPRDGSLWLGGDMSFRVLRGGCWACDPRQTGSASRGRTEPHHRTQTTGFRVARSLAP